MKYTAVDAHLLKRRLSNLQDTQIIELTTASVQFHQMMQMTLQTQGCFQKSAAGNNIHGN